MIADFHGVDGEISSIACRTCRAYLLLMVKRGAHTPQPVLFVMWCQGQHPAWDGVSELKNFAMVLCSAKLLKGGRR